MGDGLSFVCDEAERGGLGDSRLKTLRFSVLWFGSGIMLTLDFTRGLEHLVTLECGKNIDD